MKTKYILTVGLISGALFLTGCEETQSGDLLYNNNFEVISVISDDDCIYEVRDKKTGVHYITDYIEDSFCPYYTEDGRVKVTKVNDKYINKEIKEDSKK